jgi:hypothetical protein
VLLPHFSHGGRIIAFVAAVSSRYLVMARPYTGGSAIGLSATDAWAEPLPVMFNHAPYSKH